ncbi:hypothetical protein PR048_020755 [Dryococelus australis]|uniref:Uncharacterized protein n=1 Tax=Dryococelus australis TaxID=614101 RepID=A0ABQ9GWA4_9NEOP|nr:hypothetical protein PR048_020755 [Dryococelus australis]
MIQVSVDGPSVNLKSLKGLKNYLREDFPDNLGTCSLHIVHSAYKTADDKCDWKIPMHTRLLMTNVIGKSPVHSAYKTAHDKCDWKSPVHFSLSTNFPTRHVFDSVFALSTKKYIDLVEKNPPQSENLQKLKVTVKDELSAAKLGFMFSIWVELESFLTDYQTNQPRLPFMYTDLNRLIMSLINKIKLIGIDLTKKCNLKTYQSVDIGFEVSSELKGVKEILILQVQVVFPKK